MRGFAEDRVAHRHPHARGKKADLPAVHLHAAGAFGGVRRADGDDRAVGGQGHGRSGVLVARLRDAERAVWGPAQQSVRVAPPHPREGFVFGAIGPIVHANHARLFERGCLVPHMTPRLERNSHGDDAAVSRQRHGGAQRAVRRRSRDVLADLIPRVVRGDVFVHAHAPGIVRVRRADGDARAVAGNRDGGAGALARLVADEIPAELRPRRVRLVVRKHPRVPSVGDGSVAVVPRGADDEPRAVRGELDGAAERVAGALADDFVAELDPLVARADAFGDAPERQARIFVDRRATIHAHVPGLGVVRGSRGSDREDRAVLGQRRRDAGRRVLVRAFDVGAQYFPRSRFLAVRRAVRVLPGRVVPRRFLRPRNARYASVIDNSVVLRAPARRVRSRDWITARVHEPLLARDAGVVEHVIIHRARVARRVRARPVVAGAAGVPDVALHADAAVDALVGAAAVVGDFVHAREAVVRAVVVRFVVRVMRRAADDASAVAGDGHRLSESPRALERVHVLADLRPVPDRREARHVLSVFVVVGIVVSEQRPAARVVLAVVIIRAFGPGRAVLLPHGIDIFLRGNHAVGVGVGVLERHRPINGPVVELISVDDAVAVGIVMDEHVVIPLFAHILAKRQLSRAGRVDPLVHAHVPHVGSQRLGGIERRQPPAAAARGRRRDVRAVVVPRADRDAPAVAR